MDTLASPDTAKLPSELIACGEHPRLYASKEALPLTCDNHP
jgi:hypothetical protein